MRGVRHLLALGTAAVCGVLLYCLRLRFPNPLTEALGPANASPWETGKLVFWAMLPAAAVLRRLEGSGGAGLCAAILLRRHCWRRPWRWASTRWRWDGWAATPCRGTAR